MRMRLTLLAALVCAAPALSADGLIAHPVVRLTTTEGVITVELDTKRAPLTVEHFVNLVRSDFYSGTIFHRVVRGFVVQGGGYSTTYEERESEGGIPNESGNGLSNVTGTIAMARTEDPHSANSQFYFNLADNTQLDPRADRWGYAVFGKVIEGMEIVETMGNLPTGPGGPFQQSVPAIPIIIEKAEVISDQ